MIRPPRPERGETPLEVVLRNLSDKAALLNQIRKCESFGEIMMAVALWRARDGWNLITQGRFPGGYRVDLVVPEAKLCIEVDGVIGHGTDPQRQADERRQTEIEARGWLFLRISASDAYLRAGECAVPIVETIRDILARPVPQSPEEELAAAIARTEHAIANFEAHLSVIDLGDLESRQANEGKLRRLRVRLEGLLEQREMLGRTLTWEEEEAYLRRLQERALVLHGLGEPGKKVA